MNLKTIPPHIIEQAKREVAWLDRNAITDVAERGAWLRNLPYELKQLMEFDWPFWARAEQLEPEGDWATWLLLAGRGFGKTETGANWVRSRVQNGARSVALIAETGKDLEEVMVPRLLKVTPPDEAPEVRYKPLRLRWPNGAVAYGYNGTEPDQLRGPEFDTAWVDELAKYRKAKETWDMLKFTMRRPNPRVLVTTTPRPIPIITGLVKDPTSVITRGTLMDNAANLDPSYVADIRSKYEGTRLGRQEIMGEIVDDVVGALWTREMLDRTRVKEAPQMARVVVAIDPSGTGGQEDDGDDVGIIVAGRGVDGRGYILADRTCKLSPDGWSRLAVTAYHQFEADRIVAERNFGGAMVAAVIRNADRDVAYKEVTASRGKSVRAEPISALYEQGRVSHVGGFSELEDEMVLFTSGGFMGDVSPNRADALVWALTEVMLAHQPPVRNNEPARIPSMARR